jgi:hypothetical protein
VSARFNLRKVTLPELLKECRTAPLAVSSHASPLPALGISSSVLVEMLEGRFRARLTQTEPRRWSLSGREYSLFYGVVMALTCVEGNPTVMGEFVIDSEETDKGGMFTREARFYIL